MGKEAGSYNGVVGVTHHLFVGNGFSSTSGIFLALVHLFEQCFDWDWRGPRCTIGVQTEGIDTAQPFIGKTLLIICWMVRGDPWHLHDDWKRVLDPSDLFHNILERKKHQLMKSIDSPFVTGPLSLRVGRDGGEDSTDEIMDGSLCPNFISTVDQSKEIKTS